MSSERVELGRYLFFDKRLSSDGTLSCASCHESKSAFASPPSTPLGVAGKSGTRNAPAIINRLFSSIQFWDGRAVTLEEQVRAPLVNPNEMGRQSYTEVIDRIRRIRGYKAIFQKAFGTQEITMDHIAQAIASFERTLLSGNSPFDKFETGGDANALSESAIRGLRLFRGKSGCQLCHSGFNFTDELFHNLGVGWGGSESNADLGRYAVTKRELDKSRFKTPTLREIVKTFPYMHDGSLKTLEEVIDFYDRGGNKNPNLDQRMRPLNLTGEEKKDLIEFLKSLSGEGWQNALPPNTSPQ